MKEPTRRSLDDEGEFFAPAEVAERLKLKLHHVWELIRTKQLKAYPVGNKYRISEAQIKEFLNAKK